MPYILFALVFFLAKIPVNVLAVGNLTSLSTTQSSYAVGITDVTATFVIKTTTLLPQGQFIEIQLPSIISNQPNTTTFALVSANPAVAGLDFAAKTDNPSTGSVVQNGIFLKTTGADIPADTTITFTIGGLINGSSQRADSAGVRTITTPGGSPIDGDSNLSDNSYRAQVHLRVGNIAFQGTVTNAGGTAVPSAYVNIFPAVMGGGGATPMGSLTDSAGKYIITTTNVSSGSDYILEVFPPFNGGGNLISPDRYTGTYSGSPISRNFQFGTATKTITGTITYSGTSVGVTSAQVNAFKMNGAGFAQATTNSLGVYTLMVGGGDWGVMPQSNGSADWSYGQPPVNVKFVNDNTVESQTVNISVYQANSRVTGRLLKPNGDPVTQADNLGIGIFSQEGRGGGGPIENNNGTFSIAVPAGTYNINVWAPPNSTYGSPSVAPIAVADGETKSLGDITLVTKDATITGYVRTEGSTGIAGVRVNAFVRDGGGFSEATTGGDGSYSLSVTSGRWMVMPFLNQSTSDYALDQQPQEVSVASGGNTTVNFTLKSASSTITGVLQDSSGAPVSSYGYAFAETAGGDMFGPGGLGGPIERGNFSFKVPAGTYTVKAGMAPGSSYSSGDGTSVTIADGETKNIVVTLKSNDATITGSIVDDSGNSISGSGIFVFAVSNSGRSHNFQQGTVSGSTYTINVAAGEWSLGYFVDPSAGYMSAPPDPSLKYTITSGSTTTKNITLKSANATISGQVLKPDGTAAIGAFVSIDNRETEGKEFFNGSPTDNSGNYSLRITSGTYKVRANVAPNSGYLSPAEQSVTVAANGSQTVNFTLRESNATIGGNITLGSTAVPAFVYAWSDDGGFTQGQANSSGTYSLSASQGSTWHVGARYEDGTTPYESSETSVSLTSTTATANLTLSQMSYSLPQAFTTTFDATEPKIINLTDGAEVNIPASALASSGNVTLTITPKSSLPVKKGDKPIWYGYSFTATDSSGQAITSFNSSITITFPYTDAQLTALGITADDLVPSYFDDSTGTWKKVSNVTVNTTAKTVTVTVDHFTDFALTANATSTGSSSSSSSSGASTNSNSVPSCNSQVPGSAPTLFRIDRTKTTAKLYFAPSRDPVTYYYIAYGHKIGDYRYGVSFDQGHSGGVLNYTIKGLKPNVKYYFSIRAGNGCMPGPWSNWFPNTKAITTKTVNKVVKKPAVLGGTTEAPAPTAEPQVEVRPTSSPTAARPQPNEEKPTPTPKKSFLQKVINWVRGVI